MKVQLKHRFYCKLDVQEFQMLLLVAVCQSIYLLVYDYFEKMIKLMINHLLLKFIAGAYMINFTKLIKIIPIRNWFLSNYHFPFFRYFKILLKFHFMVKFNIFNFLKKSLVNYFINLHLLYIKDC